MAAYAAVVCLMNTLNNIQIHPRVSTFVDLEQIESLHIIINFLLSFIESSDSRGGSEEEVLESRIASIAHSAEDVIESHLVEQILAGESSSTILLDLEAVIQDVKSVQKKVEEFKEMKKFKDLQFSYSTPTTSSKPLTTVKNAMVGLNDELFRLMDMLTGQQPDLQIVPIVGMGGIGKTTLAKNVYENLFIIQHFDIRCWVIISQKYCVRNLFSELLSLIKDREKNKDLGKGEIDLEADDLQLGLKIYKSLFGRRYLVVLDDMWSTDDWDAIKFIFPENGNGSRVVITTRILNVATHLSSSSFEMNFLDEDTSWKLFCGEAFLEDGCPPELEVSAKKIVKECKGLPLSIVVIGGLLQNSSRTQEYYEYIARDLNSILMSGNDEYCLDVLSLSYNHLPAHLKPCFLYMGVFPEDTKIDASQLIKLFVSEGFLKPKKTQNLEEIAEDYLKDLVDRNLILVDSWKWNGRIKNCKFHDIVREICLKIGEKEKFFHGMRMLDNIPPDGGALPLKFRLLRVLTCDEFMPLVTNPQQVNLRCLTCKPSWRLKPHVILSKQFPSSLSLLWNLQTLIIRGDNGPIHAPSEIWYMTQLRHLQFNKLFLPDPPPSDEQDVLPNLQTLSRVENLSFTEEVCKRIPNIKRLSIRNSAGLSGECQKKYYFNLDLLHKLQSLNLFFLVAPESSDLLNSLVFPSSLMKLSLYNCHLHWEELNTFGLLLPHLEFLQLHFDAVVGPEWDCVEGLFPRLKFLYINSCGDLTRWTAENSNSFPVLQQLHLKCLVNLENIPSCMGEIDTLEYLNVHRCNVSVAISSTEILEEQLCLGNEELQVEIMFNNINEVECFRGEAEVEGLTVKNLVVSISTINTH